MKLTIILFVSIVALTLLLMNIKNVSPSISKSTQDACPGIDVYPTGSGGPEYRVRVWGNTFDKTLTTFQGGVCFNLSGYPAGYYDVRAEKVESGCNSRTLSVYWSSGAVYSYPEVNICEGPEN